MLTKTKLAAALAASPSASPLSPLPARPALLIFGTGDMRPPVGYASYVVNTRHGPRVCHWLAEYTDWGFYVGDNLICSRRR